MYSNIKEAHFIGRRYDEPGNIKLILGNGDIAYIELKLVESGKGTRANISQDALTELGLIYDPKGKTISWSEFRRMNKFDDKVLRLLNEFTEYPKGITTKEDKAKYLRDKIIKPKAGSPIEIKAQELLKSKDERERKAAQIVLSILELARDDKLAYISYLSGLKQNSEKIKRFVILLLLGFHKSDTLKEGMKYFDRIMRLLQEGKYNYKTFYVIKKGCNVHMEDLSCLISTLLNTEFRIEFPQGQTNVIISYLDPRSNQYRPILRVVFHWKNIFQGIKTPCLNVFDEGILKDYISCP